MDNIDSELLRVLGGLDPKDQAQFTKGGKPDCNYLTEKLGRTVSRKEADSAFAALEKEKASQAPAQEKEQTPAPAMTQAPIAGNNDQGIDQGAASSPILTQAPIPNGEKKPAAEPAQVVTERGGVKILRTRRLSFVTKG